MIKKVLVLVIIILSGENIFAQKYYKIQGTKRIFTIYDKKESTQLNDTTFAAYYIKNKCFLIAVKSKTGSFGPYLKYNVLNKKEKAKVKAIGRESTTWKFIDVNLLKAENVGNNTKALEKLL